jgi:hypothetical protein
MKTSCLNPGRSPKFPSNDRPALVVVHRSGEEGGAHFIDYLPKFKEHNETQIHQ